MRLRWVPPSGSFVGSGTSKVAGPSGQVPPRAAQAGGRQGPVLSLHGPSRRVGEPSAKGSFNWKKGKEGRDLLLTVALLLTFYWQEVVPGFYLDLGETGKCTCGEMETH